MKNKPCAFEIEGWLVYRKAVVLRGYGEVQFVVVTDVAHTELGSFLLQPSKEGKTQTELLQHYFRSQEPADSNKLSIALQGLARAKKTGIKAETATADAWYWVPWLVTAVLKIPGIARFVSRLKSNYQVRYNGECLPAKELWSRLKLKRVGDRSRRIATVIATINGLADPVRLVFLQELDKASRVKAQYILVCTDTTWTWEKIVKAYKLRWSIEVFFRTGKQRYGLQSFHTRQFNKIACHVTFSFLSYLLSARLRICSPRLQNLTMGEILDRYLNCLVTLTRRGSSLIVYLDPAFVTAFGVPFDTS